VAGAVLYANGEKSNIGEYVLARAGPLCQEALEAGDWRSFKLLLRFLACLTPLYQEDGIVSILDELFNRAVDLQTESPEDVSLHRITSGEIAY
jgi:nuclear cap-binding protein subunit 1